MLYSEMVLSEILLVKSCFLNVVGKKSCCKKYFIYNLLRCASLEVHISLTEGSKLIILKSSPYRIYYT